MQSETQEPSGSARGASGNEDHGVEIADSGPFLAAPTAQAERRNFTTLALYQILHRVGWIFKTESVVMPAFLDYIGGTAWLRGCLPLLNRVGHSVPPVLFSRRLKVMPQKKWALVVCAVLMGLPWLLLSSAWFFLGGERAAWMPWAFLVLYGLFFVAVGLNQMVLHTLTGKLVRATRRGRLLTMSTAIGAPAAIVAAGIFLGPWLARPDHGFGYIFGFTGLMFLVSIVFALALAEPADAYKEKSRGPLHRFTSAYRVIHEDRNFRRLAIVAALFSTVLMLFPHYQALGREYLDLNLDNLMLWVIVQNAGTGLFSLLAGPVADRSGNRRVLRVVIMLSAVSPIIAATFALFPPEVGRNLFWIVFVPIGLTPVSVKVLANYTLEICPPSEHPRYISTLSLCIAGPIMLFSPLIGLSVSLTSFGTVFVAGALVILTAGLLTWRLPEPRHGEVATEK